MKPLISFEHLGKHFGKLAALDDISLQLEQGEVFGLLGPNGAGKTTLIRCLLQLLRPSSGSIFFQERPLKPKDIHQRFGFLPENFFPPQELKAKEFLEILNSGINSRLKNRVKDLLELVGLKEHSHKSIKAYSRGMIQRLGLAVCLLNEPEVLILDEPTLGLDPLGQKDILSLLEKFNQDGKTIFFSSHILSQIEKVCNRIGIIHCGRMRFVGRISQLLEKHRSLSLEEAFLKEIEEFVGDI